MNKVWTRQQAETEANELFDAAKDVPQIVEDVDGRFVLTFDRTARMSVKEWAMLPGTLEDDEQL